MDWGTLAATMSGAVIAICGTVLADRLRTRHDDDRGLAGRRREAYIEFIAAAGEAHTQLRQLAKEPGPVVGLEAASRAALAETRLYEVRERLYIDASPAVAGAGQAMFERLRELRRVVATGAALPSPAFHDAYHPYLAAVWAYRLAARGELDGGSLTPADFGWDAWDGRERCPQCDSLSIPAAPAPAAQAAPTSAAGLSAVPPAPPVH